MVQLQQDDVVCFRSRTTGLNKESTTAAATTIEATTIEATTIEATTIEATTIEATTIEATTIEATTIEATTTAATTAEEKTAHSVDDLTTATVRYDFKCYSTSMEVFIPVDLAPNSVLTLKDPSCPLQNNGTHYVISFPYTNCGTSQTFYSNIQKIENEITVHVVLDNLNLVQFAPDYTIPLQCSIPLNNSVQSAFQAVDRDRYSEKNGLKEDVQIKEFSSALYKDEVTEYPVKIPINREIFFEVALKTPHNNSNGISVDKCEATPTTNTSDPARLLLISNGCSSTSAVKILPRPGINRFRFSIQAFHFSGSVNQENLVYVHCYVNICKENACNHFCSGSKRRRRSARKLNSVILTSGSHIVTAD